MGSRLGKRVVSFANLPIKLLMPTNFNNINEIAIKTIPSASKPEIKRVLESLYGFQVEKVQTLNMEGKKKKRGGILHARPDYKKAYITLKNTLSISPDWFPVGVIEEEKKNLKKQQKQTQVKSKASVVEDGEVRSHWLDEDRDSARPGPGKGSRWKGRQSVQGGRSREGSAGIGWLARNRGGGGGNGGRGEAPAVKFPWSSMRPGR